MTDSAPRDLDQLASDLTDGLLPPDEAARLRADPQVAARVARIEALRAALRSSPPAPSAAGAIDRMVAAAVDAALPASGSGSGSGPRPLQAVRPPVHHAPPAPRRRSAAPWLAAAAALLVGLAMAGLLARGSSDSDEDMATSAPTEDRSADSADDAGGAGDSATESGAEPVVPGDDQADATAGSDSPTDESGEESTTGDGEGAGDAPSVLSAELGAFDAVDDLADRVRAERAAAGSDVPPASSPLELSCPGRRPQGDTARGTSTYTAEAEFRGERVTVHVYDTGDGLWLVATDMSCDDVIDVPYQD